MNYTKGEWKVIKMFSESPSSSYMVQTTEGKQICGIWIGYTASAAIPKMEHEANAFLIAAAPDMYEALKVAETRIHNEIRYHPEAGDYRKTLQDELRQITESLAKVEGRASVLTDKMAGEIKESG